VKAPGQALSEVPTRDQGAFISLDLKLLEKSTNLYLLFYYVRFSIITCLVYISRILIVLLFKSAFIFSIYILYSLYLII
jgi:hypothetical protein